MPTNNFIELDKPGRDKFHSFCYQYNYTCEDTRPLCGVDVLFTDNEGNKYAVELKNRSISTDKYPTFFLEIDKYNTLLRWSSTGTYKDVYYINFVGNKMYIYSIYRLMELTKEYGFTTRWMNAVTAQSRTYKVPKSVCELPKEAAIKYIYTDKWNKE